MLISGRLEVYGWSRVFPRPQLRTFRAFGDFSVFPEDFARTLGRLSVTKTMSDSRGTGKTVCLSVECWILLVMLLLQRFEVSESQKETAYATTTIFIASNSTNARTAVPENPVSSSSPPPVEVIISSDSTESVDAPETEDATQFIPVVQAAEEDESSGETAPEHPDSTPDDFSGEVSGEESTGTTSEVQEWFTTEYHHYHPQENYSREAETPSDTTNDDISTDIDSIEGRSLATISGLSLADVTSSASDNRDSTADTTPEETPIADEGTSVETDDSSSLRTTVEPTPENLNTETPPSEWHVNDTQSSATRVNISTQKVTPTSFSTRVSQIIRSSEGNDRPDSPQTPATARTERTTTTTGSHVHMMSANRSTAVTPSEQTTTGASSSEDAAMTKDKGLTCASTGAPESGPSLGAQRTSKLSGGQVAAIVIFSVIGGVVLIAGVLAFVVYRLRSTRGYVVNEQHYELM